MYRSNAEPRFLVVVLMTSSFLLSLPASEGQVQSTEVLKAKISELLRSAT